MVGSTEISIPLSENLDLAEEKTKTEEETPALQPDPETLHTTDPQEEMKGPISSLVQGVKEKVEENDEESKEEATKKRDEHM